MEENKKVKIKLSTIIIILLVIAVCIFAFLFINVRNEYNKLLENSQKDLANSFAQNQESDDNSNIKSEKNAESILDSIYIDQNFIMASNKYTKELFVSCNNTTAKLNEDGKLEINIDGQKSIVEGIEDEIIDLKLGIVNQYDGKDDINTSFVRDVFVLTKFGDVYAVNITYGYRPDLVSKILTDVVKIENAETIGLYDYDDSLSLSVVVAKKADDTIAICDDGESDGL